MESIVEMGSAILNSHRLSKSSSSEAAVLASASSTATVTVRRRMTIRLRNALCCLLLSLIPPEMPMATSSSSSISLNARCQSLPSASLSLPPSHCRQSLISRSNSIEQQRHAFIFSMLKRRRTRRTREGEADNDNTAAAAVGENAKRKDPVVVATVVTDQSFINGDVNNLHRGINGDGSGSAQHQVNGYHRGGSMKTQKNAMLHNPSEENNAIPYYYADPSQQHKVSSIDRANSKDDEPSILQTEQRQQPRQGEQEVGDEVDETSSSSSSSSSTWAKRNARSIDEGVRFKSQLRDGLEEQGKLHREQLLSNLLEGVVTTPATTGAASPGGVGGEGGDNNPFVRWWTGIVSRREKDAESEKEVDSTAEDRSINNGASSINNITADDLGLVVKNNNIDKKEPRNYGNFAARLISGLIMALAEEVEGLDVKVEADANTPAWNKTVHSIQIYFSRLGFRQLRMGGFVSSEFDSPSSTLTTKSTLLEKTRRPATANETFDTIDVDKSGALDENELAQALKMAALIGGNKFVMRSKETLTELASRLVRLYDADGDGVVDRNEYQAMVQDMASLREARIREELQEQKRDSLDAIRREEQASEKKKGGWLSSMFGGNGDEILLSSNATTTVSKATAVNNVDNNIIDVTSSDEFWGSMDYGEGSIVLEGLNLDLRRLFFGVIPGVKRILPGGPLILKPFTATITASFNKDDIMDSFLLDAGLRRLVARALRRRVRGIRDLLDGAVFYGRTWKLFDKNAPDVEVLKLEDVQFDNRNRLIITGRAKIKEALGYKHEPIEQGFKLRTKIGTRANGRIIGLLQPEIAIFAECPKDLERTIRSTCKEWFGYTIPVLQPWYTFIPLVSPLKKNDNMDGFNLGEDNEIKSITIKDGKLRFEISSFLRPGRFLGNHYLAFTVPNRTLILTLDRVREGMRNARRNKRLAEIAAREVKQIAAAEELQSGGYKPTISPEGRARIQRLEKELKATIQEDAILREMEEKSNKENGKSFLSRFVEGYAGAIREELDLEMNARLSSSISDFFGSQDRQSSDYMNKS